MAKNYAVTNWPNHQRTHADRQLGQVLRRSATAARTLAEVCADAAKPVICSTILPASRAASPALRLITAVAAVCSLTAAAIDDG